MFVRACTCECVPHINVSVCPQRQEELHYSGGGVKGSCQLPSVVAGDGTLVLWKNGVCF